jgi:carbon starvation protein
MRKLIWVVIAVVGAFALGGVAVHRGESINSLWIVVAAVCVYTIGYRLYSACGRLTHIVDSAERRTPDVIQRVCNVGASRSRKAR